MVTYYKTIDGVIREMETCEPGCWISCVAPEEEEINRLIEEFSIEPDFFRAAMDEEESSHLDTEDGNTLVILDIPCKDNSPVPHILCLALNQHLLILHLPDISGIRSNYRIYRPDNLLLT